MQLVLPKKISFQRKFRRKVSVLQKHQHFGVKEIQGNIASHKEIKQNCEHLGEE